MEKISEKNDFLKLIAIITMVVDHIGYAFFPDAILLRIIGRIAFPIFAYQITLGYSYTRDIRKYYLRLFAFAMVSQIPYLLVFPTGLNIFFNLIAAVFAIDLYTKKRYPALIGFLIYIFLVENAVNFGYGIYGVLLSLIFYIFKGKRETIILLFTLITIIYCIYYNTTIQFFAVLALPLIYNTFKGKIILNKWWFYLFYPVHIIIICVISLIL